MIPSFFKSISRVVLPEIITVGIDIQDRHLIGVAAAQKAGKAAVIASGIYELAEDVIEDGEIKKPEAFKKAIGEFLNQLPASTIKKSSEYIFVLSLPPHHVYTETAFFPMMNEADLAEAIRLKIETSLPWPLEDSYVDWRTVPSKNPDQIGIFIVGVSKQVLNDYLLIFFNQGWRVAAAEFHMLSLSKFINPNYVRSFIFALIDEDGIEFAVFSGGKILIHYLQTVPTAENAQGILENKINHLANYIKGNFGIDVERVFIFDKISRQYTLDNIQNKTGIAAQMLSPSPHLDPRLFVAYGAALRSYGPTEGWINLMPAEMGGRYHENILLKTISLWTKILLVFAIPLALSFGVIAGFLWNQRNISLKENKELGAELQTQINQADPLIKQAEYFNKLGQNIKDAAALRALIGPKLREVENRAEETGLKVVAAKPTGPNEMTVTLSAATREAALKFQDALKNGKLFSEINLPIGELTKETDLRINMTLKY